VVGKPEINFTTVRRFGQISRGGSSTQVTYDGHPLHTYIRDGARGQDNGNGNGNGNDNDNGNGNGNGNGISLSGGVWHAMTVSGSVIQ
jgi:hypothetical protein